MPSTIRGKCTFYLIRIIHWTLDIHRIKCATITGAFFHENCVEIGRSKLFRVILVLTISTKQKKKNASTAPPTLTLAAEQKYCL